MQTDAELDARPHFIREQGAEQGARMQKIADQYREALQKLELPHLVVSTNDNIMSSVSISVSLDPREKWSNGIFENSRYFQFLIFPGASEKQRWYHEGDPVRMELLSKGYRSDQIKNLRKYTGPVEKAIPKLVAYIESAKGL